MCGDPTCPTCHTYVVVSDIEKCTFGTFSSEEKAIAWAKEYNWPDGTWRVVNLYPVSIG